MPSTTTTRKKSSGRRSTASASRGAVGRRSGSTTRSSRPSTRGTGTAKRAANVRTPARNGTRRAASSPRARASDNGSRSTVARQRDALAVLRDQHREVEQLFKEFEGSSQGARQSRRRLVDRMIAGLSQHASIEEQYFYPAVRREIRDADSEVLRALEEHHVVTWELNELDGLDPADAAFGAKVSLLIDNVRRHVRAEERELFPEVRRELDRPRLLDLGAALESAVRLAPTHPHPRTPTTPPANLVGDPVVGAIDKARDFVRTARSGR
ncbi:MAG: hemerythrin domain-containing protein [Acidimicrobiales bacterium]|nr:hemerythrin domain-containing protein [Acidimicrobiales bacterium]